MTPMLYDQTRLRRVFFVIALIFVSLGLLLFSGMVRAAGPYVVNSLGDAPDGQRGDGVCRTVAGQCTLRAAIQEANNNPGSDLITFAPTFTFPVSIVISPTLVITDGVTINGPGAGLLTLDGINQSQIFSIDSPNSAVNILNLTVANGRSAGNGGAILFGHSDLFNRPPIKETLNLTTVVIRGGSAQSGGGIYMLGGFSGFGFYTTVNLALNLTDVTMTGNRAIGSGGAIVSSGHPSTITINSSNFIANAATGNGGAINANNSSVQVTNSTFSNNRADNNANTTLSGNVTLAITPTPRDGGAIYSQQSHLDVLNSTLSGNSATGNGGAIAGSSGLSTYTLSIRNSTIVNNKASIGGGLYQSRTSSAYTPTTQVANTIIAGNTISGTTNFDDCRNLGQPNVSPGIPPGPPGNFTSLGYNLTISGTSKSCDFTSTGDQRIQPSQFPQVLNPTLANNGGPTLTHALLPNSSAIDNGGNCPPPTTDQRGVPRPMGARCDIGAYEAVQAAIVVTKTVGATPGVCAATSALTVDGGTNLYYCVTIRNSGNVTLTNAIVRDPALNISVTLPSLLAPGAVVALTNSTVPAFGPVRAGDNLTNRVTVTATNPAVPIVGSISATGVATATVVVIPVYSISLTPDNVTLPVGFTHSVTATVVDHQGRPASSIPVTFKVTGANVRAHNDTTDSTGRVSFAYIGRNNISASDTITASLGQTGSIILGKGEALSTIFLPLILNRGGSNVIQGSAKSFATATVTWQKIRIGIHGDGVGNDTEAVRTITATVTTDDAARKPVATLTVGFTVTGGNFVEPKYDETDLQGQTVFTYTSKAPTVNQVEASAIRATDTITVWVDLVGDDEEYRSGDPYAVIDVVSAITLASFTAQRVDGKVNLAWQTAVEIDNAGFNLYRATASGGPYTKINDQLIGAQGNGTGASYAFVDTPPDTGTFFYKLEDVDYNGVGTLHGPINPGTN